MIIALYYVYISRTISLRSIFKAVTDVFLIFRSLLSSKRKLSDITLLLEQTAIPNGTIIK